MVFEILQHDNPEECVLNHIFQDYEDWIGWLPDEFSGLAETKLRRELVKFAPTRKLHLQVFADQGQGFSESVSIRRDVACDKWQTIRIEHLEHLHTDPAGKLRIDPINHCGLVTLTSIRVFREHDDTNLYLADSEEEFRKIAFTSGLLPYFEKSELMLLAMEPDPQMLLPSFGPLPEAGCTLEMTLKVEIADAPLLQQFREFHDIREEHARLREKHAKLCEEHGKLFEEHEKVCAEQAMLVGEHEKLRGEKENLASQSEALAAIVESAKRWQRRSWFKRAFHRWRPPAG